MRAPFDTLDNFSDRFNRGLVAQAEHGALGPFILACANATSDPGMHRSLAPILEQQFGQQRELIVSALRSGRPVKVTDEDLLVFLKMAAIGLHAIHPMEERREGPWRVQFNLLRSFRPRRISQASHAGIHLPYDGDRFNFNKPFLQEEKIWKGELLGRGVDLYYNKYPFAPFHCLLVPEREACLPQFLRHEDHQYLFGVGEALEAGLPGIGIGYNSLGGYASVNHLHFQLFVDERPLPVEEKRWRHNGGPLPYPLDCHTFDSAALSWEFIESLHERRQPYNLLYRPGRVWVMPRRAQGEVPEPHWSSGLTWFELAGCMVTFNSDDFSSLTEEEITAQLGAVKVEME